MACYNKKTAAKAGSLLRRSFMILERKATKREILDFIAEQGMIEVWQLRDKFGYTHESAKSKLSRLKKEGLVINMTRDRWELTEKGYKRRDYYRSQARRTVRP